MTVYKRLTQWTEKGASLKLDEPQNELEARIQLMEKFKLACNKLAELEDKIENGTLIELPCKVGATIYALNYEKEDPCSWCKHDHSGFGDLICDLNYDHYPFVKDFLQGEKICPQFEMVIYDRKFNLDFYHDNMDWFNITWFLTKAEAEKKLKELQEKDNDR